MTFLAVVVVGLAVTYCLTIASFAWQDLVTGTVVAAILVAIYRRAMFPNPLPRGGHVIHIIVNMPALAWLLFVDIVKGTWTVALCVLGIQPLDHPGIVKIPLGDHSRAGVGIVALLVTISPGSFMVDIDWEESAMLVHFIDASNPARLRRDVEKYYRIWEYDRPLDPEPAVPEVTSQRSSPDA